MHRTLDKTRKQIAKKKGAVNALHAGSRDSRRLRKALIRDERLDKIASTRRKLEQPLVDRAAFFQEFVREIEGEAATVDDMVEAIKKFVHQYDEEMAELKRTRRAGRPPSTREDLLKIKMAALEKEFQNGFLIPELTDKDTFAALERWEGSWLQLTSLVWVRITDAGAVRPAAFPPNKD
ncbi:hypothetical protein SPI_06040 [Niveomyces insectorum RCEF 264]|uniref:Translation machinery-associated protein 16 n=1 Tax=Niveomyces insectorum RCEF 264 TaxID=1081102 RepID=A0A167SQS8_9HYPO|nr:hypothetical protein SPI_06040 [Niveomyces insectorum RCEF 264]